MQCNRAIVLRENRDQPFQSPKSNCKLAKAKHNRSPEKVRRLNQRLANFDRGLATFHQRQIPVAETLRSMVIGWEFRRNLTQSDMHLSNQSTQNRWELGIPVHAMLSSH
jgi:hypothetical protein